MKKVLPYVLIAVVLLVVVASGLLFLVSQYPVKAMDPAINDLPVAAKMSADLPVQTKVAATEVVPTPEAEPIYALLDSAPAGELWIVADGQGFVANSALVVTDPEFASNKTAPQYVSIKLTEGGFYPATCKLVDRPTKDVFTVYVCNKVDMDK